MHSTIIRKLKMFDVSFRFRTTDEILVLLDVLLVLLDDLLVLSDD